MLIVRALIIGLPPPPSADLSSVPPTGSLIPSYQESKPAVAWNDPPTVLMKVQKQNPVKVNTHFFLFFSLSIRLLSQSAVPLVDNFVSNQSPFLQPVNEPSQPPQNFHFNPAVTNQPTGPVFPPNMQSDFVQHPIAPSQESTIRKVATPPPPPAPVVKGPIPAEHQVIQETFDLLVARCQQATQQLPLKRKLDDVKKKLEVLYDKLRENRVPASVLQGMHQMIGYIRQCDYQTSLSIYNQLVASENLAETSQYMPAIKILLQCCMQLNVYCQ